MIKSKIGNDMDIESLNYICCLRFRIRGNHTLFVHLRRANSLFHRVKN